MDISPYVGHLNVAELPASGMVPYESVICLAEYLEMADTRLHRVLDKAFTWTNSSSPWRQYSGPDGSSWVKRFSNYAYKEFGIKIAPEMLSKIGDYISQGRTVDGKNRYLYEIAKHTNWRAGAFENGKETCWWGSYNEWRIGLQEHPKGYSVLFYESEAAYEKYKQVKGLARCWLMNEDVGPVIFNAYNISLTTIARVLATTMDKTYERIHLSSGAYINAGSRNNLREGDDDGVGFGYLIKDKDAPAFRKPFLELSDFSHKDGACVYCGKGLLKKNALAPQRGVYFCSEECMYQLYAKCENCGNLRPKPVTFHAVHLGFTRIVNVCDDCYRGHDTCENCGETLVRTMNVWHTSRKYCTRCVQEGRNGAHTCSSCGHVTDKATDFPLARQTLHLCPTCTRTVKEALHGD